MMMWHVLPVALCLHLGFAVWMLGENEVIASDLVDITLLVSHSRPQRMKTVLTTSKPHPVNCTSCLRPDWWQLNDDPRRQHDLPWRGDLPGHC